MVYQDEVWWSRLAQPELHSWAGADKRLTVEELSKDKQDEDKLALCCYGELRHGKNQLWLRFVAQRAVSTTTILYLSWLSEQLGKEGIRRVVVVWDNAPWHCSKQVRSWLKEHNRAALAAGRRGEVGVQVTPCWLPVKSPWLNPIEVRWAHGKRAVVEPSRKLTIAELQARVYDYYQCERLEALDANGVP